MKQLLCTLTLLASVLASTSAVGATMRCNDGIVSTGESTQGVLDKCGAPSSQATDSPHADEWLRRFWAEPLRKGNRRYYDNCLYFFCLMMLSGVYKIY